MRLREDALAFQRGREILFVSVRQPFGEVLVVEFSFLARLALQAKQKGVDGIAREATGNLADLDAIPTGRPKASESLRMPVPRAFWTNFAVRLIMP